MDEINECRLLPPPPINIEWDSLPDWGKDVIKALAKAEAGEEEEEKCECVWCGECECDCEECECGGDECECECEECADCWLYKK